MSATTTPCVAVCASKVLASLTALAACLAAASARDLAVAVVPAAVIDWISASVFLASVELVVVVEVVDCVDVEVIATVAALVVAPVMTDVVDVTLVGLVADVVAFDVAMVTGSVLAVLVADSVTAVAAVAGMVVPIFRIFFLV